MSIGGHSFHKKDWAKVAGLTALAATGAGAAGFGPMAGMFSGAGAGAAGAGMAAGEGGMLEAAALGMAPGEGGMIGSGLLGGGESMGSVAQSWLSNPKNLSMISKGMRAAGTLSASNDQNNQVMAAHGPRGSQLSPGGGQQGQSGLIGVGGPISQLPQTGGTPGIGGIGSGLDLNNPELQALLKRLLAQQGGIA